MKKKVWVNICFVGITLLTLLAWAPNVASQPLKIGVLNFPPFFEFQDNVEPSGIMVDLLKNVVNQAGFNYSLKGYPPKRLYQYIANGKVDILLGIKGVSQYDDKVVYSKNSPAQIDLRVYTRPGTTPPKSKAELNGKSLIVIRGYSYGGTIEYLRNPENNIRLDETSTHEQAFKKLKLKRADYVLDYKRPSDKALQSVDIDGLQSRSLLTLGLYFIVSKKTPNASVLVKQMEQAYETLKKDGKL